MSVKAKFYVAEVARFAKGGPANTRPGYADPAPFGKVVMRPVTRGEENKEWASATPSGSIEMTVAAPALKQFEEWLGGELIITFDRAPGLEED